MCMKTNKVVSSCQSFVDHPENRVFVIFFRILGGVINFCRPLGSFFFSSRVSIVLTVDIISFSL